MTNGKQTLLEHETDADRVRVATRAMIPKRYDARDPNDPWKAKRESRRVKFHRGTLAGRAALARTTDILGRLGREPSPVESALIDRAVAFLGRAEAKDMVDKPERHAQLVGSALRILATLGINSFGLTSEPDSQTVAADIDARVLSNLMER
jgi:hypothetical protein